VEEFLVSMQVLQVRDSKKKTLPELLAIFYFCKLFESFSFAEEVFDLVVFHDNDLFVQLDRGSSCQESNSVEYLLLIKDIHDPRFVSVLFSYDRLFNEGRGH
jgi:hypothetical protein